LNPLTHKASTRKTELNISLHQRIMSELRVKINNKLVDIDDLKVTELKAELKKRGVSTAGRKEELQEKLKNVSHGLNFAQVCSIFS
jgi:hypothetical protein